MGEIPVSNLLGLPEDIESSQENQINSISNSGFLNNGILSNENLLDSNLDLNEKSNQPFEPVIQLKNVDSNFQFQESSDTSSIRQSTSISKSSPISANSISPSSVDNSIKTKPMQSLPETVVINSTLSTSVKQRLEPVPANIEPIHFQLPTRKWVEKNSFMDLPINDGTTEVVSKLFAGNLSSKPKRKLLSLEEALAHPDPYHALLKANSWRALAILARNDLIASHPIDVEKIMRLWWLRWWAMSKLGLFDAIQLEADKLEVFDSQELQYDAYQDLFPSKKGPMISFELRLLISNIPSMKGNHHESINRLYQMLYSRAGPLAYQLGKSSRIRIVFQIINVLLSMDDLTTALSLLDGLSKQYPQDPDLLSSIGRLHLQTGNIRLAKQAFMAVEKILEQTLSETENPALKSSSRWDLILSNRAFLCIALGDYSSGVKIFTELITQKQGDATIVNNMAVCQLYSGNVSQAANFLESIVIELPDKAGIFEPIIFNLSSMYDLTERTNDKKKRLIKAIIEKVGDDFRGDCFKL